MKAQYNNKLAKFIFVILLQINHYRNIHNISVVGRHVPEPCKSFEDFKVDSDIVNNLKKCGYEEPTPIQKQAVPLMLDVRQFW